MTIREKNLKVSINISLRAGSSPLRGVARSHARVARERRRECEKLCRSLACSLAVGFPRHIKWRACSQATFKWVNRSEHGLGKMVRKIQDW